MRMRLNISLWSLSLLVATSLMGQQGLRGDYFDGSNFDRYVTSRTDSKIDFAWNDNPPVKGIDPHNCTIKWTGFLVAPETGTYTFSAKVDDGIRVFINEARIIESWGLNDNGAFEAQVEMTKGQSYALRVEYFNALIEGEIKLLWVRPSNQSRFGTFFRKMEVVNSQYFVQKKPGQLEEKPAAPPVKVAVPVASKPTPVPKPKAKLAPAPPATLSAAQISKDTVAKYTPRNVEFKQSKAIMLEESKPGLNQLADFLIRYKSVKLTIEGHTDVIGEPAVNQVLSLQRAQTVADYLVQKGIASERLKTIGYGSQKPLFPDDKEKGNSKNRRVVFLLE
jgi:outer membrane protein OmpA-like peptidoglycan-associated protein